MGFWENIDNDNKENISIYRLKELQDKIEETNNLSSYNPIIDKFYKNH